MPDMFLPASRDDFLVITRMVHAPDTSNHIKRLREHGGTEPEQNKQNNH
jgi:hypothetical protein